MKSAELKCLKGMKMALSIESFTQRGTAFFRVYGDGILQVVKLKKQHPFSHYAIQFGLFSMYDSLEPAWFSSAGAIPQYDFVNLLGEQTTLRCQSDGQFFQADPISIDEQHEVMCSVGISFLNKIHTQSELINAYHYLDPVRYGNDYPPNMDIFQFAPYLYIGERESANSIIEAYLCLHKIPENKRATAADILEAMQELNPGRKLLPSDIELARQADLVRNATLEEIQSWLHTNYSRNQKYLR